MLTSEPLKMATSQRYTGRASQKLTSEPSERTSSQRFTGSASQKEAARVMNSECLERGRREREAFRSSKRYLREQESRKFAAETLKERFGVGCATKIQDFALGEALCGTSALSAKENRLWGREGDSARATSLREAANPRAQDCSTSQEAVAVHRDRVCCHIIHPSTASWSTTDSDRASDLGVHSCIKGLVASPGSIASSHESRKLKQREEAKQWWCKKVARERQMAQIRKSLLHCSS